MVKREKQVVYFLILLDNFLKNVRKHFAKTLEYDENFQKVSFQLLILIVKLGQA